MVLRYVKIRDVIEHLPLLAEKNARKEDSLSSYNVDAQGATKDIIIFASSSLP